MKPIVALLALQISLTASAETLTIRADDWFPMNGDPASDKPGYMIELAQAVFEPHGINVDYQLMPWERALYEVRRGKIDCVVGAYKEDAPDLAFPEQSWGLDSVHFFIARDDSWRFNGELAQLLERRTGMISGYGYGEVFDAFAEQHKDQAFFFVSGDGALDKNIKKLLAGRIDTLVESEFVLGAKAKEMGVSGQLISAGQLTEATPMYIACTPDSDKTARYMQLVNDAMPQLKSSGKLQAILDNYGLNAW
ncbi:amino acid ABC transporter substrate-binding protein [Bacterioplanes sanyensis]|uniref:substrate-binding periplasmic protein n=1 Tax=Bacterioplanes sanyensis TaxID=1249553 RepID=UPI0016792E36|nr:transporter substrate-binding domain-containing protein [Bacterioplanes sanyensis]GGY57705.1 amino acid ABC transporter substrate-binding protein [Bacterioplanes sanyensis]